MSHDQRWFQADRIRTKMRTTSRRRLHAVSGAFEQLEIRCVHDSDGTLDAADRFVTLSFAADGTPIGDDLSNLFDKFSGWQEAAWQDTILRAFQTWAAAVQFDVGIVADTAQLPFGTPGPSRADERFGDIRIGARPLAGDTMALSVSQSSAIAGTWAADMIFNSTANFASLEDLFSVTLHEVGHILGLEHSSDPLSPLHVHGVSPAITLTHQDIALAQANYGQRLPDRFELHGNFQDNNTPDHAFAIDPHESVPDQDGSGPAILFGELSTPEDVDWYQANVPGDYTGETTITLWSAGISLLQGTLLVTNGDGTVLGQHVAAAPGRSTLVVNLPHIQEDEPLYIRADAESPFDVGAYTLSITFDGLNQFPLERLAEVAMSRLASPSDDELDVLLALDPTTLLNDDQSMDDRFEDARELEIEGQFAAQVRYRVIGSLAEAADRDHYRFAGPDNPPSSPHVIRLNLRSLDNGDLVPQLRLYAEEGQEIPVEVLANGAGDLIVQAMVERTDREFVVEVASEGNRFFTTGNYQLTIEFDETPVQLAEWIAADIEPDEVAIARTLHIATPQLFHFLLAVDSPAADAETAVLVRIMDANQHAVLQFAARPGETRSAGSVLLTPGSYVAEFLPLQLPGSIRSARLSITLSGAVISDPFAIDPADPSDLEFQCPDLDAVFCYPGNIISEEPFLWDLFLDELPVIPPLSGPELYQTLLGDWWKWYWNLVSDNGPPLALPDRYQTDAAQTLSVSSPQGLLANDVDPEQRPLLAVLLSEPTHGTLRAAPDGGFTYTPAPTFRGWDSFTYQAFDMSQPSDPVTVTIEVGGGGSAAGDFNHDGAIDTIDIDLLAAQLRDPTSVAFDLTGDGLVDQQDWDELIGVIIGTVQGDANLDGIFDSSDLVLAFQAGFYETEQTAGWDDGDWNADGLFTTLDLVLAFQRGAYSPAARRALR